MGVILQLKYLNNILEKYQKNPIIDWTIKILSPKFEFNIKFWINLYDFLIFII